MTTEDRFERGSEWRQWDLHIHTPASFHWNGAKFDADPTSKANATLVDEMIGAMNAAKPSVFALMDYWTLDGWFALKRRLAEPGAPKLTKTVFPGIELRLSAPTKIRLNAHVIFSDATSDQALRDFKSALQLEVVNRPLSNDSLIELAQKATDDKLKVHGFKRAKIESDHEHALFVGSTIAELTSQSYIEAIKKVPNEQAIGFMPWDTSDGLKVVKWEEHYAYFLNLFLTSPIFESRNIQLRDAFVNEVTPANVSWIKNFQAELRDVPRLVVSGSDAHCFVGAKGDNDNRGYGDFPVGKETWIKADPSFLGLRQAIMEPAKRSFIGKRPPKLVEIDENKTFFIDRVVIGKTAGSALPGNWLDGATLPLNPDLVAIIGNKGSGKSALADVIALLGNSKKRAHFSFLKKDRFRGKSGEPAKHFFGTLSWCDGATEGRNLNEDPPEDKVELVRYIPHGHFEELCNDHVAGRTNLFDRELRAVIFSHASDKIRLGALDFEQLVEQQEASLRDQLSEFRKDLGKLNQEISNGEAQLQPEVMRSLLELLAQKSRQIDEHQRIRPAAIPDPADVLSPEQQVVATKLDVVIAELRAAVATLAANSNAESLLAGKLKAVQSLRERLRLLVRSYKQFEDETAKDVSTLGLEVASLVSFTPNPIVLDEIATSIVSEQTKVAQSAAAASDAKAALTAQRDALSAELNEPQLTRQKATRLLESWNLKLADLIGTSDAPDTLSGLETRIAQLKSLPDRLASMHEKRLQLTGDIFDILDAQRSAREQLFKPVQDLIQGNTLIRDEYKLQFQATLGGSSTIVASDLFSLIKQNSGEFRGEDESHATVRKIAEQYDFNSRAAILAFVEELHAKVVEAATGGRSGVGITSILRKEKTASDVYNLLFGLSFLAPRYSLLFQDAQIEQLSPGQRGALLLIFYLLVDKGRTPIILDQPEENLDNQSVVSLLVPVLTEAKKRRQIIMVTHNPNLAVVCDAEQVVYSSFDRKNGSKIGYTAGAIENPSINAHVVNVLEGTKPAFNNRRVKYH